MNEQLVFVCDGGGWGNGLLSLNLKTRLLSKLFESNEQEQILSVCAGKDQLFILTGKALKQVAPDMTLVRTVFERPKRCDCWLVQI